MTISRAGDTVGIDFHSLFPGQSLASAASHWNDLNPEVRNCVPQAQHAFRTSWTVAVNHGQATISITHDHASETAVFNAEQARQALNDPHGAIPAFAVSSPQDQRRILNIISHWMHSRKDRS